MSNFILLASRPGVPDFMALARSKMAEKKISLTQAMSELAAERPEMHAAWKEGYRREGGR